MTQSYPLQWPEGWPRSKSRRRAAYQVSIDKAVRDLHDTLRLLGALRGSVVVSSNVMPKNLLGVPRSDGYNVSDPGVAVYWTTREHGDRFVACDRWSTVRDNVRAIGLALEGLRSMERAGATQIFERAFQSFGALPAANSAPVTVPWWDVFGFPKELLGHLTIPVIEARYRERSKQAHPDRGGSDAEMAELNRALADAKAHYGGT